MEQHAQDAEKSLKLWKIQKREKMWCLIKESDFSYWQNVLI